MAAPRNMTPEEADAWFLAHQKKLPNGCSEWTGAKKGPGYGSFQDDYVHRWAYERFIGPIPKGHTIDHTCHNADKSCLGGAKCPHRKCVELTHLEAVPLGVNSNRSPNSHASKTHCKRGHPFSPENTYRPKRGGRMCRTCARENDRKRYPKRTYDPVKRHETYLRKKARDGGSG